MASGCNALGGIFRSLGRHQAPHPVDLVTLDMRLGVPGFLEQAEALPLPVNLEVRRTEPTKI